MRELEIKETTDILGGRRIDRIMKQWHKCANGSSRACGRVNRMYRRHMQ